MTDDPSAELDVHPALGSLIFFGVDHALYSVEDGETLIPFLITEKDDERVLTRFLAAEAGRGVEEVAAARGDACRLHGAIESYLIAYDGYITIGSKRTDCIYVEGGHVGSSPGVRFAQRYEMGLKGRRKAKPIGNPIFLGQVQNYLSEDQSAEARAEQLRSIEQSITCEIERVTTTLGRSGDRS